MVHSPWTGRTLFVPLRKRNDLEKRLRVWLMVNIPERNAFWEVLEMKRRAKSDQRAKGEYSQHGEAFLRKFPEICKVLWDCWYEDGSPRELGKLTIGLVPDGVNIAVTDPSERLSAFCTAATLNDALKLLEDSLSGSGDPWRPWPASFGKKKG